MFWPSLSCWISALQHWRSMISTIKIEFPTFKPFFWMPKHYYESWIVDYFWVLEMYKEQEISFLLSIHKFHIKSYVLMLCFNEVISFSVPREDNRISSFHLYIWASPYSSMWRQANMIYLCSITNRWRHPNINKHSFSP